MQEIKFEDCVCGADDVSIISELGQRYVCCWTGCGLKLPVGRWKGDKNTPETWNDLMKKYKKGGK